MGGVSVVIDCRRDYCLRYLHHPYKDITPFNVPTITHLPCRAAYLPVFHDEECQAFLTLAPMLRRLLRSIHTAPSQIGLDSIG